MSNQTVVNWGLIVVIKNKWKNMYDYNCWLVMMMTMTVHISLCVFADG